jgi:hypothetical protein
MGMTPVREDRPTLIRMVYNAARLAGQTREPSVSDPRAAAANPAETPTAEPEEEPHGSPPAAKPPLT